MKYISRAHFTIELARGGTATCAATLSNPRSGRSERRSKLVRGIALGRQWLSELTSGKVRDTVEIATRERRSQRSVHMMLSLAFLAPDIVEAAAEGRLPRGIGMTRLTDLPPSWANRVPRSVSAVALNAALASRNRTSLSKMRTGLYDPRPAISGKTLQQPETVGRKSPSVRRVLQQRQNSALRTPQERDAFAPETKSLRSEGLIGGRCRNRTYDPLIKSQLLYQLS